jgi:hypothetical protein
MGLRNLKRYHKDGFFLFVHGRVQGFLGLMTGLGDHYPKEWKILFFLAIPIFIGVGIASVVLLVNFANTLQSVPTDLGTALQSSSSVCNCNQFVENQQLWTITFNQSCLFEEYLGVGNAEGKSLENIASTINETPFFIGGWQGTEPNARNLLTKSASAIGKSFYVISSYANQISTEMVLIITNITQSRTQQEDYINITQIINDNFFNYCFFQSPANITLDKVCPTAQCYLLDYPSSFQNFSQLMIFFNSFAMYGVFVSLIAYELIYSLVLFLKPDSDRIDSFKLQDTN